MIIESVAAAAIAGVVVLGLHARKVHAAARRAIDNGRDCMTRAPRIDTFIESVPKSSVPSGKALEQLQRDSENDAAAQLSALLDLAQDNNQGAPEDLAERSELLTRAFDLERQLSGVLPPCLLARRLALLGKLQVHLGHYRAAAKTLRRALSICAAEKDTSSPVFCDANYLLGIVHYKRQRYELALPPLNRALHAYRRLHRPSASQVLQNQYCESVFSLAAHEVTQPITFRALIRKALSMN